MNALSKLAHPVLFIILLAGICHGRQYQNTPLAELTTLAEQDNNDAQCELAERYARGEGGVKKNIPKAFSWIKKAADLGNPEAADAMAEICAKGDLELGIKPNETYAKQWAQAALTTFTTRAEAGDVKAQLSLYSKYRFGSGVATNREESLRWLNKAVNQGSAKAFVDVGSLYAYGDETLGIEKDFDKSVKWYTKAADKGLVEAKLALGDAYKMRVLLGDSSREMAQQDSKEAFKWYWAAAQAGSAEGQSNIGAMYYQGRGCDENPNAAFVWLSKAAAQNYAGGDYYLGEIYFRGRGALQDYESAAKYCLKSRTIAGSQYRLGVMYANGYGVPRDMVEAYKWANLAAKMNDLAPDGSLELRDEIAKKLTPQELNEGQRRARMFPDESPQPADISGSVVADTPAQQNSAVKELTDADFANAAVNPPPQQKTAHDSDAMVGLLVLGLLVGGLVFLFRKKRSQDPLAAYSALPSPIPASESPHAETPTVEEPTTPSNVRFCSGCGTPYSPDPSIAFCSKCGRQFLQATTADSISSLTRPPPMSAPHAAKYPGISRLTYFLGFIGALFIYGMIIGASGDKTMALLVLVVIQFILILHRLRNTGTSLWFSLLGLIPIVGMIVMVRCLACQEGYQQTKKLDQTGKIIAGIVIGAFCVGLVLAVVIPLVMK